jgi:hypothetical protein
MTRRNTGLIKGRIGIQMKKLLIPEPISGGLLLSYRCTSECRHCMYASSPKWNADWIDESDVEEILTMLSGKSTLA